MARLTIDLDAVRKNYLFLQNKVRKGCEVSAVVKANAYGLGVEAVSQTLHESGCKTFFVATLNEAIELRSFLGREPAIAMLNGYQIKNASLYRENDITPVLNDLSEIQNLKNTQNDLPAMIHIDTAMNRLGMNADDITPEIISNLNIKTIMSHFMSSEDNQTDLNAVQASRFEKLASQFPNIPKSLCNSSGIFLDASYHYQLVRPGMALYGLNPTPYAENPMQPVISLDAEILQIHTVKKGETAGYNATYCFEQDSTLAIVDIGYADGIFRSLSNAGSLYWNGIKCPIRGRVSMDLTIVDLCDVPENQRPKKGDHLEVIGLNQSADDLARDAGTIGYEVLTSLSRRHQRIHSDQDFIEVSMLTNHSLKSLPKE